MKSFSILLVFFFSMVVISFTNTQERVLMTVNGHLVDFKSGEEIVNSDLVYFTDPTVFKAEFHSSGLSKTDSNGNFSFKLYVKEPDRSFDIGFIKYAGLHFEHVGGGQTVNLGDVYAVAYNNELNITKGESTIECFDFVEKMDGDSILFVLQNLKSKSNGFVANPIDTVKIGNSAKGSEGPNCWYNYKTLSLTKDLSK